MTDGSGAGGMDGGQARRLKARPSSSWSTQGAAGACQGGAGVGGELGSGAEVAVRGVAVGERDVLGVGVGPGRVEQRDRLEDVVGCEAGETAAG